ncbi:MAG: hypothetical protein M3153_01920 [Chloroflexota bacterium]|nr:hypothetical protein [Chloroflexota bacterium]
MIFTCVHPDDVAAWEAWTPKQQAVEAADMDEAVAIASKWPSLASQAQAPVQVQPVYRRE